MSANKKKTPSFEEQMVHLEELAEKLEDGDLDLDKSLSLFEEGVGLYKKLNARLDEAEKKLEILMKDENDRPVSEPFTTRLEDDDI